MLSTAGRFIGAFAIVAMVGASGARANIVLDGDFSVPSGGASFTTYSAGQSFGPWNVNSGSVDLIGNYWQSPTISGGSVDLDGFFQAGSISQLLTVPTTGLYNLSFALAGNPDGGAGTKTVFVTVASASQIYNFTVTNADNHSDMGYVIEVLNNISLTAGSPTTLTFASLDDAQSAFGPVIGAVNMSAVPEPSTWAMIIIGFCTVGFLSYRKRSAF